MVLSIIHSIDSMPRHCFPFIMKVHKSSMDSAVKWVLKHKRRNWRALIMITMLKGKAFVVITFRARFLQEPLASVGKSRN